MAPLITKHLDDIRSICRDYGVARLEVFGSVVSGEFDPASSDADFIVTYPRGYNFGPWMTRFNELEERLALLLGLSVDLVMATAPAMSNKHFRREADRTRVVVYDASQVAEVA